jgi:hypothetical protein
MRVLLVIMSCLKNDFLWKSILEKHKDCIIFCGKKLDTPYLFKDRILTLNCRDTYEGLPEKVICMIDAVLSIPEFSNVTHIFKIDDHDTGVSSDVVRRIDTNIFRQHYIGQVVCRGGFNRKHHIGKCSKDSKWNTRPYLGRYSTFAYGGTGYILSRKAMTVINNKYKPKDIETVYNYHIYEDVMIGLILLHDANIIPAQFNLGITRFPIPLTKEDVEKKPV